MRKDSWCLKRSRYLDFNLQKKLFFDKNESRAWVQDNGPYQETNECFHGLVKRSETENGPGEPKGKTSYKIDGLSGQEYIQPFYFLRKAFCILRLKDEILSFTLPFFIGKLNHSHNKTELNNSCFSLFLSINPIR